jgi:hypothetical protein
LDFMFRMQERKGATETSMLICQWRLSNWPVKCAGFVAVLLDHTRGSCRHVSWRFTSICVADGFHILHIYSTRLSDVERRTERIRCRENRRWFWGIHGNMWIQIDFPGGQSHLIDSHVVQTITESGVYGFFCQVI